jgi:hypothetical protein
MSAQVSTGSRLTDSREILVLPNAIEYLAISVCQLCKQALGTTLGEPGEVTLQFGKNLIARPA